MGPTLTAAGASPARRATSISLACILGGFILVLVALACRSAEPAVTITPSPTTSPPTASPSAARSPLALSATPASATPTRSLTIRRHDGTLVTLDVEVATTPAEQEIGLSVRETLAPDHGMLFVFASDAKVDFWMRGTKIPLSIAFIQADGRIVDIQDMQPLSDDRHGPPSPIRYALEVNQGDFTARGIDVGDTVDLAHLNRVDNS